MENIWVRKLWDTERFVMITGYYKNEGIQIKKKPAF